jgi:hypothetical protein
MRGGSGSCVGMLECEVLWRNLYLERGGGTVEIIVIFGIKFEVFTAVL